MRFSTNYATNRASNFFFLIKSWRLRIQLHLPNGIPRKLRARAPSSHIVRQSRLVKNCDLSSVMMGTWFVLFFCRGQNNVYVIKTPSYDLSTELLYPSHDMDMFLWAPTMHVCLVRTYTSLEPNTSEQEAVWIWPAQNFWLLVSSV
jgi:hypothetical protein